MIQSQNEQALKLAEETYCAACPLKDKNHHPSKTDDILCAICKMSRSIERSILQSRTVNTKRQ